jgi:quercetin dioxygenase-like cupin family protein
MSYPDARYMGEEGEISATFRPADQEPELTIGSSTAIRYLATRESTNGQYGLYRWEMRPHTSGARAHFHRTMFESFFILSGTVRLFNGEQWIDATRGDFLYVPEGGVHGFHYESDEPASMLLLFAPGGPREAYFETITEIAAGRLKLSDEEWRDFLRRHDSYFV